MILHFVDATFSSICYAALILIFVFLEEIIKKIIFATKLRQQNTISLTLHKNISSESDKFAYSTGKDWSFLSQFLVCMYRLKFDAFSDINNFVDNLKIQIFDINNLR